MLGRVDGGVKVCIYVFIITELIELVVFVIILLSFWYIPQKSMKCDDLKVFEIHTFTPPRAPTLASPLLLTDAKQKHR